MGRCQVLQDIHCEHKAAHEWIEFYQIQWSYIAAMCFNSMACFNHFRPLLGLVRGWR
jgi:hypothetical protein